MKLGRAAAAGITGGVAMTILGWIVRQMGVDMNAEMMLGTMVDAPGAFMAKMGAMFVALFVLEHLMYGGIVGGLYGPVR